MRLPAKPYQTAIASAVQTMADRKNSFGRGKNETNIVCIQSQVRRFPVPLSDSARAEAPEAVGRAKPSVPANSSSKPSTAPRAFAHLKNSSRHWEEDETLPC